ncbi:LytR/AlgR family response regulator transcription factor [Enhygromyxa salina]|uniref:Transcriptional regulatory protein YehT n=1 Tax=Enhygromyxa salina TaxID=215803 RepID=A0A2S9YTW7_9BACT|nr:LytTR family DNA-binding domain-containing protein [Enhygromyxa salina]PRQ08533.1 Transcriptional regulatory protein YehT [Enhygromyxa salina]
MRVVRALVVDDEAPARRRLIRMLERVDGVEVSGQAADGIEALERITADAPDLVFLDIQMPALDGLALARSTSLPPFVFVTAHDEHALAAFEVGAADYLLKPVSQARLLETIERVRVRLLARADQAARAAEHAELHATLARLVGRASVEPTPRVSARDGSSVRLFEASEIGRFYASDKYTLFVHGNHEQVLDESLSELELRLGDSGFMRVHRSELVNLQWVRALHGDSHGAWLELRDGQRATVSRRMLGALKRRLGV